MILIIEGIDRVGKTTLANKISKKMGAKIWKHKDNVIKVKNMDNDNETDKMLKILDVIDLIDDNDKNIIFDRFHISDFSYGIINRKYDVEKAKANLSKINDKIVGMSERIDIIVVYVNPTNIVKSSKEHGSDLSDIYGLQTDALESILAAGIKVKVTDYLDLDFAVDDIVKELK